MEKVNSINLYPVSIGSAPNLDKSHFGRGHHSSVSKAVDAHRSMVEERQTRNLRRDFSQMAIEDESTNSIAGQSADTSNNSSFGMYESTLIESPSTQAKMANIQAFQSTEPERPVIGEPVPKGSYIDVEA